MIPLNIPSCLLVCSVVAPTLLPHDCGEAGAGPAPLSEETAWLPLCRGSVSRQIHKEFN